MKIVWLLRHAKSSWENAALSDHDRPLAPRGHKAGTRLRRFASDNGVRPELVLCSTALRARATLDLVRPGLGTPRVELDGSIYLASPDTLLRLLRLLEPTVACVMLVGHNPGLHELACLLAPPGPEALPTGALVEMHLEIDDWPSAKPGCATLERLVLPRALGDS
jgi:phosphohistidine phosphatase